MRTLLLTLTLLSVFCTEIVKAADWRPIPKEELTQKTPRVDPTADAEAIFWDVRIEDKLLGGEQPQLSMIHYIRIKIFTELGRETYSTVEIPRYGKRGLMDVAGRTIKADGTIIELDNDAIFDRELVKSKALKLRGKTFTLPNVAVGDIIEYRYKETRDNELATHLRVYFQRELPIWNVTYHLKPLRVEWVPYRMRIAYFHCEPSPFQEEPQGFSYTSLSNVPAFREEPDMPPEDDLRAWMLIYYEEDKKLDAEKYWKDLGKSDFRAYKPLTKVNDLVRKTAAELVSGLSTPEDKLAALDTFCRTKIRNLRSGAFRLTDDERKAVKENRSPGDTLKQMAGDGSDVNLLFVALATAAGFDARMARVQDGGDFFFNRKFPSTYFLQTFSVAVKAGDKWVLFDPSTPYLDRGMLRWQEEGGPALISDPKEGFFVLTQYSDPSRSMRRRRATFKLLDNGALEGTVEYTYTGHVAVSYKQQYQDMTPAQQEEDWKQSLQSRLSTAELSGFQIRNASDADKPLVVQCKLNVPGYATRTAKRILLQPAFFQRNALPRYTDTKRKWDLYYHHGWAEEDEVVIDLPDGWQLDEPRAPVSSPLGQVGSYSVEVLKTPDGRKLIYSRKFEWGRNNARLIPASAYPAAKQAFDFVQDQDNYTIALKAAADAQ